MVVTLKDVATLAKVSPSTVSLVANKRAAKVGISDKTRRKVLRVMEEMGYVPSMNAQSLASGKTLTIGAVITDILHPAMAFIMEGAKKKAREGGYHVIMGVSSNDPDQERFYIRNFLSRRVDGMLVIPTPSGETMGELRRLNAMAVPMVICEMPFETEIDSVGSNVAEGSYKAVKYLFELGHRRIALASGHSAWCSAQAKYQGYLRAFEECGLTYRQDLHLKLDIVGYEAGLEIGAAILQMSEKPDALLCHNDEMAAGVINVLLDHGLSVPDDLSVIGFDDIPLAKMARVPLTTVASPLYEVGWMATEMLLEKIQRAAGNQTARPGPESMPRMVHLSPKLVIRASTAARR